MMLTIILKLLSLCNLNVSLVKFYPPAFPVTVGGKGGASAPDHHGVGHKAVGTALEGIDDAVSGTKEADEEEYSPAYCKSGEGCAQLVVAH